MTDDPCTPFAERAAILEYLAGYPRPIAEAKARAQIEEAKRRREQPQTVLALGLGATRSSPWASRT
jgi:hypothetical protein